MKKLLLAAVLCAIAIFPTTELQAQNSANVISVTKTPIDQATSVLPAAVTFQSFDAALGGWLAFAPGDGSIGLEDYIMDLSGIPLPPATPTVVTVSIRFVGGVTSNDGAGGQMDFVLGGSAFSVGLPSEGNFIWNITVVAEIPTSGTLELNVDPAAAANVGRAVVGQWFIQEEPTAVTQVGSSPADPSGLGAGPGNGFPLNFAFEITADEVLPVELSDFNATVNGSDVAVSWSTLSEVNNAGFEVQRKGLNGDFETVQFVEGVGNSVELNNYSVVLRDVDAGQSSFRLKQIDFDGSVEFSHSIEATVELPSSFVMNAAYPNPFNPSTKVQFAVADSQPVTLEMYDVMGVKVKTLYNGAPNSDEFVSVSINAADLASGNYMLRLTGEDFIGTQMISLVK